MEDAEGFVEFANGFSGGGTIIPKEFVVPVGVGVLLAAAAPVAVVETVGAPADVVPAAVFAFG